MSFVYKGFTVDVNATQIPDGTYNGQYAFVAEDPKNSRRDALAAVDCESKKEALERAGEVARQFIDQHCG
jgi:hypothetical protein